MPMLSCRGNLYGMLKKAILNPCGRQLRDWILIKSKDGIGECVFNINFLSENPEFIPWKVIRVGQGKFEYERRSEAEIKEIKQKLADSQDILDEIKANPSKPGIRTKAFVARNSWLCYPQDLRHCS